MEPKPAKLQEDEELVLSILWDRQFHHVLEIMDRGKPGARNWAVRSRVAGLRERGYDIETRIAANHMAEYRLRATPAERETAAKRQEERDRALEKAARATGNELHAQTLVLSFTK